MRTAPLLIVLAALLVLTLWWLRRSPAPASAPSGGSGSAQVTPGGSGRPGTPGGMSPRPPALAPSASTPKQAGHVIVHGGWGSGASDVGRRRDPESNPEQPMAIAASGTGDFVIVDQVNRRVQRYHQGKLAGSMLIGGDTVQDIALGAGGRTLLLDRLA